MWALSVYNFVWFYKLFIEEGVHVDKVLISEKGNKSSRELSEFLRTVANKIDEGKLTLTKGKKSVELVIPDDMGFRFKIKDDISRNETKRKVQIGFRWRTDIKMADKQTMKIE